MSIICCDSVESLDEFLKCVRSLRLRWHVKKGATTKGAETQLWYRGQKRATSWTLVPRIYRDQFSDADEDEIRFEFDSRGRQLRQGGLPNNEWEKYFLMQHYGAPTRLLDWTDNPLIALFFAVDRFDGRQGDSDSGEQEDAAVWVLDPTWLNRQLRKGIKGPMLHSWKKEAAPYLGDPFEHTIRVQKPAAMDPPHVDPRLSIQASHFVIFGLATDLTKTTAVRKRDSRLAKIPIVKERLDAIQDELEICGITWGALFPDLEGLCKGIRQRWSKKYRAWRKTTQSN